jgi:predicted ATP-grasp superfamily ATP-dependent carboligase
MGSRLLIVGASGRAAAASAIRAGYDPFVIDLFADADTQRLCPVLKCDPAEYPHGFIELAKQAPPDPWMYTGGLENYPDVVDGISKGRELWGIGGDALRVARNEKVLAERVRSSGGNFPETVEPGSIPWDEGKWLRKPRGSSGGFGIRFAGRHDFEDTTRAMQDCLQQFVFGEPMSAIFHTTSPDQHRLFGITRQLVGIPWLHAKDFCYSGNVSRMDHDSERRMQQHSQAFNGMGFHSVWGEDFIRRSQGPWTIEVNPRYTAAIEVLELASGAAILSDEWQERVRHRYVVAKGIYYAPHDFTFPHCGAWDDSLARCSDVWTLHDFADIPHPGTPIDEGQPVITIFAQGETEADCLQSLQRRAAELDRLFGWETSP